MDRRKNIRKIPDYITAYVKESQSDNLVVYTEQSLKKAEIKDGKYALLGVTISDNQTKTASFIPQESEGRFCKYNTTVRVVVCKDQPKKSFYIYATVPNFGDTFKGWHEVAIPRMAYPRKYIHPSFLKICPEILSENENEVVVRFVSSELLNRNSENFNYRLFSSLNIFQELFRSFKIKDSSQPYSDYLKEISIDWEILPEGKRIERIKEILQNSTTKETNDKNNEIIDRFKFLEHFHPKAVIKGSSGFLRYIGYQFSDELVVFENLKYGNALYVMFSSWEDLSKRSRIDLLSGQYGTDFERIIHGENWRLKLQYCLERHNVKM